MAFILHKELSQSVLGAAFKVHNYLGPGLLESAYEGALVIELKRRGHQVDRQVVYPLYYEGEMAGAYVADIVVEGKIILELKSAKTLTLIMEAQLINYLHLSAVPLGYLMNFRTNKEGERNIQVILGYSRTDAVRRAAVQASGVSETDSYSVSGGISGKNPCPH